MTGTNREQLSRKEQAARTETALKAAARVVFARQGFLSAKISDITAEAGRAAGSFYNHFASKEAVLEALLTDWITAAGEELGSHGNTHDLSDRAHLRWHVEVVWRTYQRHSAEIRALNEAAIVNEAFARRLMELRVSETQVLRDHLEQMRAAGVRLPGEVHLVASAMVGLLNEFCVSWVLGDGEPGVARPDDDQAIDTLTDFLLYGLRGPTD